jgi:O-antigen ligase
MPPLPARSDRSLWVLLFGVLTVVVVSAVPWRTGDIYNGGVDPVVIAKAIVGITGFALALLLYFWSTARGRVGVRSLSLFAGIVLISTIGAIAAGNAGAALVLTVRIVLMAATVVAVVKSAPPMVVLTAMLAALGAVAIVSAATGAAYGFHGGRLSGGIPQMAPNGLAGLAAPPAIGLAADIVKRGIRPWNAGLLLVQLVIIFATGSRTTLIVTVVGIGLTLLFARRIAVSTAIASIVAVPFFYVIAAFTGTVATLLARGETIDQISTLNSRTVAWEAVLATPVDSWDKWIGVGLAAKTVAVQQLYRDVQVLDSSWVSVIAQAGIIGTVLLVIWFVTTSWESFRRSALTPIAVPLMAILLIRSFTENGLIESSPTFMLFLAISLFLEPASRMAGNEKRAAPYQLASPLPILRRDRTTV